MLKGDVVSSDGTPLAGISVTILKGTERVTTTKTSREGKFTMVLNPDATYRILVNESQYMYHEDTLVIPAITKYQEYAVHAVLTSLHDGENFSLADPVFLPQSATVQASATNRLDAIVDLLRHNMKLSVQVTVYPDAPITGTGPTSKGAGKDAVQKGLVASRATAVRSYFLGKGVQASRFSVVSGTTVPPGRFAIANVAPPADAPSKKKKKSAPQKAAIQRGAAPGLVPQYVEIVAHLAS
jgi:outer membrane protein OmpA-like peptidoglycan-associated protein